MSGTGRIAGTISGAVAAFGLATAPVLAQDGPDNGDDGLLCVQVEDWPRLSCATPGYEDDIRSRDEILADAAFDEMVVLHFGPGLMDAGLVAAGLSQAHDIPAVAIPGGPDDAVQVIIAGFTSDRLIFDQSAQNRGRVGAIAHLGYERRMEALRAAEAAARSSSASLVRTSSSAPSGME